MNVYQRQADQSLKLVGWCEFGREPAVGRLVVQHADDAAAMNALLRACPVDWSGMPASYRTVEYRVDMVAIAWPVDWEAAVVLSVHEEPHHLPNWRPRVE